MTSSRPRQSVSLLSVVLVTAATVAPIAVSHAADQAGDAQIQARALLAPTLRSQSAQATQPPVQTRRAALSPDAQEQARNVILGIASAENAITAGANRASADKLVRPDEPGTVRDAQTMARHIILGG